MRLAALVQAGHYVELGAILKYDAISAHTCAASLYKLHAVKKLRLAN
jgi:hypothetical protein